MRPDARRLLTLALLCLVALAACVSGRAETVTIFLVRHAEKAAEGNDPALTEAGARRAVRLAEGLQNRGIEAVWSSDYRRTRSTALPLAMRLDLEIGLYDPREPVDFARRLLAGGRDALVIGHSNTVPALAAELCGCPVEPLPEDAYDHLYVLTADRDGRRLAVFSQAAYFGGDRAP